MVINFHPKPMRTNLELAKRDLEGMHPVAKSIGWSDNEAISHLHEMLCIEGHLGLELAGWIYPSDLNVLSVNVLPNDPVQLLLVHRRWPGASREYLKGGSLSIEMPTDCNRCVTSTNQQWTYREDLVEVMAKVSKEWYAR
jgi:hypothetical protein